MRTNLILILSSFVHRCMKVWFAWELGVNVYKRVLLLWLEMIALLVQKQD